MRDKIIISTISKVYFTITSFLLFIFFSLSVLFIILQNGLYIDSISLPSIKVKQLYIKWNENLDVSIKEIYITTNSNDVNSKIEPEFIAKYLKQLPHFYTIFEKISINKITLNELRASFKYEKGEDGYFVLKSPAFSINSSLYFESNLLHIKIDKYTDNKRDIKVTGSIIINPELKTLTSSIVLDIHDDISLSILSFINKESLYYKVKSLKEIKSISYLMEELNLHKDLKYWAYEALDFSSLSLHTLYGWIDFNNVRNAYKNLYASATGNDLTYAYNKNLDRIHTKTTDLEFKDGIFYIYPKQATTYKSKLGSSWLKIDFTKPEELLTLKLLFDGKLDYDTLGILEEFKIKVPFLQNTGKTKVDLTLKVNLQTIDVDAKGEFFTGVGNFTYRGYAIDVFNLKVELDSYDVRVNNMLAKYQDIMESKINVFYNAKSSKGKVDLEITKFTLDAMDFRLNPKKIPLKASYTISPNNDNITMSKSYWRLKNHNLEINKITLPLDLEKLQLKISKTKLYSKELGNAEISGYADLNKNKVNLDFNLKDIYFGDITLNNKNNHIKIKYDKTLSITTTDTLKFKLNSEESFLSPTKVELKDNVLILHDTYLNIGNIFKTKLYAQYDLEKHKGYLKTRRARFSTKELGELYFNQDSVRFDISTNKNNITSIMSKDLEILLTDAGHMWSIDFLSIRLLSLRSKFLKKYNINNGSIRLSKKVKNKDIDININLNYPYPFMVENNIPIYNYILQGKFNTANNSLTAKLNNNVDIKIHDSINIKAKDIGININAIIDIANSIPETPENSSDLQVSINTKNSYLYISKDRHALSDQMYLYYENSILTAGLLHKEGISGLKYEKHKFHAYGDNFNDEFMESLFALSEFEDGNFGFNLSGNTKKYTGVFMINDSTILDYKVLNNILAFVNTVPSLLTFSTPGYNAKGLYVETAYMKFQAEDDIFNISDIYFHSQELDILGNGTASFKTNQIDIALKLKTDVGSSIANIPLLGYLFLDGDSLSTTLSVTGTLNNPEVNTLLGKEIIVAPLNLLLRTLTLPYYLIDIKENQIQ